MAPATIHIHPTAELAERVLLPGDPGRALRLAQALIDGPLMFNHNRGLWGYSGPAKLDGAPLSIQSTGMGGPSAAIVIHELITLGARRLLRIGTCGALDPELALGQLIVADSAIAEDGTSRALGAAERIEPDPELTGCLIEAAGAPAGAAEPQAFRTGSPPGPATSADPDTPGTTTGPVVSTDLFYDAQDLHAAWIAAGARAVEMEAATLFTLARRRGVPAAAMLIVSDMLIPRHQRIGPDALVAAEERLGQIAVRALAGPGQSVQQSQPT